MLTQERKDQLESAYQANITAGRAPYAGVIIRNTEELTWIYNQRNWSSRFWFESDKSRPDLSRANLSRANLSDADLSDADLSRADLSRADLSRANLSDADLSDADLSDADLSRADLSDADLSRADLSAIKSDIYDIVDLVPLDLPYMVAALKAGTVDGSTYRSDCNQGCLVGTLEISAKRRIASNPDLDMPHIPHNSSRPAERWFLAIRPGMTPENSQIVAWTVQILEERLAFYDRIAAIWSKPATAAAVESVTE